MKEKEIQILYSYQMMVIKTTRVDKTSSKYGCRGLESTIREDAMKDYIKILQEDNREASTFYLNIIDDVVIVEY